MVSPDLLLVFMGALAVVYALPGPDMALVLQSSGRKGMRHGFAVASGLAMARALHVTLSACGAAALLQSAPWLFTAVRLIGAVYLAWLALQIFRAPSGDANASGEQAAGDGSIRASVLRGLLGNLLNPKALLFCSVLLPQFIRPAAGAVWTQMLELGVILVLFGVVYDVTLTVAAKRLGSYLSKHRRVRAAQRWIFSGAMLGFAVRLSIE
ncbi:LysE family translocator [Rugamonas rivuli]|uniref:LysE family translocator n=1 Tax=Rugamonas rivuli TaxID=2743358 RepID=A0A843SHG4_9BURK|nr:LysE family translocator [Rugamonas rivuli]MQA21898.1 LysE family translocator [Rugamonas rivuli]